MLSDLSDTNNERLEMGADSQKLFSAFTKLKQTKKPTRYDQSGARKTHSRSYYQ